MSCLIIYPNIVDILETTYMIITKLDSVDCIYVAIIIKEKVNTNLRFREDMEEVGGKITGRIWS